MKRQLEITQPFDLELSLTMGQAFRWRRLRPANADCAADGNGWFSGVIGDNLIHIRQTAAGVEYRVGGPDGERDADLSGLLSDYFRLDDDIEAIYADLSARDSHMAMLIRQYSGMRVLRQEPWECLVSYICSANNNIKRISANVEAMADRLGEPIHLDGKVRYTFPPALRLADASEGLLRELRLGLRAPRVAAAAERVCDGELDLVSLMSSDVSCSESISRLTDCRGIGLKIANCIALMALDKLDAFPVDRWILRALTTGNYSGCPLPRKHLHEGAHKRIISWAQGHFGAYAGYAGQYLFHGIEPRK